MLVRCTTAPVALALVVFCVGCAGTSPRPDKHIGVTLGGYSEPYFSTGGIGAHLNAGKLRFSGSYGNTASEAAPGGVTKNIMGFDAPIYGGSIKYFYTDLKVFSTFIGAGVSYTTSRHSILDSLSAPVGATGSILWGVDWLYGSGVNFGFMFHIPVNGPYLDDVKSAFSWATRDYGFPALNVLALPIACLIFSPGIYFGFYF